MIIDTLDNYAQYTALHENFQAAFDFIRDQQLDLMETGKYPIAEPQLHAAVSAKNGVKAADAKFEAHDRHIDIQVCISGTEQMGWKSRNTCSHPQAPYNAEKDVTFFDDRPDMYFQLKEGQFVIFFPEDVHAPMIGDGMIRKMVVKVKR
ncbi:MAG TPA: YhcH/YjgK/YiaL family protein [Chitinophagaceae bacterium]|nr:YhcH/YjgK/YiaL family protein [Chitinophagaceae bacterium]